MSKIALCFLVTRNIINLSIWEDWWAGHEDQINIYSHFSRIGEITQPVLLNSRVRPVPTRWGDITLVHAEGELYRAAITDRTNAFFVLLSETDIPVRTFAETYQRLMRVKSKGILAYRRIDPLDTDSPEPFTLKTTPCKHSMEDYGLLGTRLYAADQWKALSRQNAEDFLAMLHNTAFVQMFTKCIKIVPESLAPDELMYVNWMHYKHKRLANHFRNGHVTYVDFKGKAIHPVPFKQVTRGVRTGVCDTNAMFARKFPEPMHKLASQVPVICRRVRTQTSATHRAATTTKTRASPRSRSRSRSRRSHVNSRRRSRRR